MYNKIIDGTKLGYTEVFDKMRHEKLKEKLQELDLDNKDEQTNK